jgi:hypothetical protein
MGSSSDRDRQKRLQRKRAKRAKRAAQRAAQGATAGSFGGGLPDLSDFPFDLPDTFFAAPEDPGALATLTCIQICAVLLTECRRLDDDLRQEALDAARRIGGVWLRLPFELEAFLCEEASWSLTCKDLEPIRRVFAMHGAQPVFNRIWNLALTNEPDAAALLATAKYPDCALRATLAFDALRLCLDDPGRSPKQAIKAIALEMETHNAPGPLKSAYKNLLTAALASTQAPEPRRAAAVDNLAREAWKLFEPWSQKLSATAWWQCGRVFLAEVFDRHAGDGHSDALAAHSNLLARVFEPPKALFWKAPRGAEIQPLRSIHFQSAAGTWLRFLRQRVDVSALQFDDRVRYEIARLKALRALAHSERMTNGAAAASQREFLAAFEQLRTLLARGVPPAQRALPGILEPLLVDFCIDAIVQLECECAASQIVETLLRQHPEDFRLACLYATGAFVGGQPKKLALLEEHVPRAQVDAELFARCAAMWTHLPRSASAAATVRRLLFDPLDREHRKQCLTQLARQALRRASNPEEYGEELRTLLPYFERENFVYRELRQKTALESELIFLATMMAPLHNATISLTESQSQQWVSHAREIARKSPLGAQLVTRHLKTSSRWFTLAPGVRAAAAARIRDFQHAPAVLAASTRAAPGPRPDYRAEPRRRKRLPPHPQQPGLFDDLSP